MVPLPLLEGRVFSKSNVQLYMLCNIILISIPRAFGRGTNSDESIFQHHSMTYNRKQEAILQSTGEGVVKTFSF